MAGGEGGFSTKAMGFDKKEVNDYIANLNQRMKEIEADKKTNDEKTQAALKKASEADKKIKAAKSESDKKIADLELQLKTERKNEENLLIQIDDLKRKLKLKQKGSADAGASKANDKAAEKKAEEIIAKANATARDIVNKANATAQDTVEKAKQTATRMVRDAQGAGGGSVQGLDEFMSVLGDFMNKVTSGVNEVNQKASELLGAQSAEPVTVPDFSNITAPKAEVPVAETVSEKPAKSARGGITDDLFAALDESEDPSMEEGLEMITEVLPLDDPTNAPTAVVLEEFDLSETVGAMDEFEEPVTEVKPIKKKKRGNEEMSEEFERQILAQTANSSMLKNDMDGDLLAAVKQQEELFAVKPSDDVSNFDMDQSEEDPLSAMLKQAELTFGTASGDSPAEEYEEPGESKQDSAGDDANPWAALQNELFAMEKTGDFGEPEADSAAATTEDPSTPNADDSAIWDFGDTDMGSSEDDDMGMSSDLFGNF